MIHRKSIWLVCFINLVLLTISNKGYSQITIWNPNHAIGTVTGKYNFSYNTTPDQLVIIYPAWIFVFGGATYQWMQSPTPVLTDFTPISGAQSATWSFPAPLTQDMYYVLKTTSNLNPNNYILSNIIKISMVSVNWEDVNYIREHDVVTTNITDWQTVDQLPIGQKLQSTTYFDGIGRTLQSVDREAATPATPGGAWGDLVHFAHYDVTTGIEFQKYLPYTTTSQSGKFKTAPLTEQPQYYSTTYNETSSFSSITFDYSPLLRVQNIKNSGASWAASSGIEAHYDMNDPADNVQIFSVDYIQGNPPVNNGPYPANVLYKMITWDENQNQVIEYRDKADRLILKKVQIDPTPTAAHSGWLCTYFVYDDFGLLRYQIQPEGVKYLDGNGWSFAGDNGAKVLAEQCYQYVYDDKGRTIFKKSPGADPINMIYDGRDRLVFSQDGNQKGKSPGEWTATLYDDLDRLTIATLYETSESIPALQADINNAASTLSSNTFSAQPNPTVDFSTSSRLNNTPAVYSAAHSITFNPNFTSGDNDHLLAEIDPIIVTPQSTTVNSLVLGNPISAANMANPSVTTILKYLFYDDYTFTNVKSFDNNFTNLSAYSPSDPNVMPIASDQRTTGMLTGSMVRILGTNTFLSSTNYYDAKGRSVQMLDDNIKGGTDITTFQHHFDGRILSSCNSHSAPGTGYTGFITLNKSLFDKLGRIISIQKQLGSNLMKTVSTVDYDDFGRVKTKHLDPGYNNPNSGMADLESLNYSYNLHGQITGINKDYALKTAGTYNKWGHFFGLYLGFDNQDHVFNSTQLSGQPTGQMWNTQGDDAQRKYDYTYDPSGRLINAAYNEQLHPGDGWNTNKTDFSVSGASGQIKYDLNGNLLEMLQKGVIPGTASPVTIDDLHYTYAAYSNKLQSVTDQMTLTAANGQSGDFKDGTNDASTPDYVYDANGNLVIDLNKNVQSLNNGAAGTNGVSYNYLDKPETIRIVGKGTIKIVYDAVGRKLQRVFIPESGAVATITTYIDEFVYQETSTTLTPSSPAPFTGTGSGLSYINFGQGRVRVMTPTTQGNGLDGVTENGNITLPNGKMGVWDYFVTDYQQNVRVILTEETHVAANTCTMETTDHRPDAEDPVFGQQGAANEVETTRYPTPLGWTSVNSTASVSRLGKNAGPIIGPNMLQKVMAGDQITASVQYYYQGAFTSSNPNIIPNILNSLGSAIGGPGTAGTLVHGNGAAITSQLNGSTAFMTAVEPTGSGGSTPQAFLTILFFDERFNLIDVQDGGVAQQQVASSWTTSTAPLGLAGIKAPKNGYAYIYVSNRSDQDVYFDNLAVSITAGNIIEENHYYAFGLKIAGISSRKLGDAPEGTLKNNYLYNEKELVDDGDIDWYDYGFRDYDAQIGRFVEADPVTDSYPFFSQYLYAVNDPISNVDVDGLFGEGVLPEFTVTAAYRTARTTYDISKLAVNLSGLTLRAAVTVANTINSAVTSQPAGGSDRGGDLKWQAYLQLVAARGAADELANANTIGLWYLFGGNHLDDYQTPEEQAAYSNGQITGTGIAIAQSAIEFKGGGTALATTGWTGGGAVVSGGVVLHSVGVLAVATHDLAVARIAYANAVAKMKATKRDPSGGTSDAPSKGGKGPNDLGKQGEKAAGIPSGPKQSFRTPGGKLRIPEHISEKEIVEVKNVDYQYLSTQLQDDIAYAKKTGRTVILKVRQNTKLSKPLEEAWKEGKIMIEKILPVVKK